jgi:hypothetical protein
VTKYNDDRRIIYSFFIINKIIIEDEIECEILYFISCYILIFYNIFIPNQPKRENNETAALLLALSTLVYLEFRF